MNRKTHHKNKKNSNPIRRNTPRKQTPIKNKPRSGEGMQSNEKKDQSEQKADTSMAMSKTPDETDGMDQDSNSLSASDGKERAVKDPGQRQDTHPDGPQKNDDGQDKASSSEVISGLRHRSNLMAWMATALIFFFSVGYMYWSDMFDKQGGYVIFLIMEVILFRFSVIILDNMGQKAQASEQPSSSELEVLDTIHFYQMCFLIYGVFLASILLVVFIGLCCPQGCFLHQVAVGFQNLVTGDTFSLMGGSFASFMVFTQFREMYKYYRMTQSAQ